MNIELDVDGERLDEGCTVDFTRESCVELVACDLHLQQTTRVPYPALGYRRRAGRWNRADQTCDFRYAFLYRVSAQGHNGLIVWEWFGAESEYDDERRCEWNLTRERIRDPSCLKYVRVSMKQTRCFNRGSIEAFLRKRLEKLLGCRETRKDFYSVSILIMWDVHNVGGIAWSRIKISVQ